MRSYLQRKSSKKLEGRTRSWNSVTRNCKSKSLKLRRSTFHNSVFCKRHCKLKKKSTRILLGVKESFDGLSLELESSRQRMQELEQELQSSIGEVQKFEELYKQSGSHTESETKRALEFEKLLEVAKVSTKDMEEQMGAIQGELKGLYDKIAEDEKVKEALQSAAAELSTVQEELVLSKSQGVDLEQRLSDKEALISELTAELDLKRASSVHFSWLI